MAKKQDKRFWNVTIQRQELDYYKSMERVALAAMGFSESGRAKHLVKLETAIEKITYCEKEVAA